MPKTKGHSTRSDCPVAHALDIIGDRWSLLILRAMMLANFHEFADFLSMPEKISTNILSDRLKKLVEVKTIGVLPHPTNKTKKLYYLTESGLDFLPVMIEMMRWSAKHSALLGSEEKVFKFLEDKEKNVADIKHRVRNWNQHHGAG